MTSSKTPKIMNRIYKSLLILLGAGLAFAGCRTLDPVVEEIEYGRVLSPLKFDAEVVPSTGTDVVLNWQKMANAEGYELEIYEQVDDSKEVSTANTGIKVGDTYIIAADEVPYTVYGLEVDKSFYARVRGFSSVVPASNWTYLEKTFSTSAVRSSLNPTITARTSSSVTLSWDDAADKADLTSVRVEKVLGDGEGVKVAVSAAEIAAASKTIEGLDPAREYRFTLLFGKAGNRGSVTAFTRPSIDGVSTVKTAAELYAAINNQSGTIKLLLDYSDAGVDMMDAYPDPAKKLINVTGDVYLYGNATEAGVKPTIKTAVFDLASGSTVLHLEDLVLDGAGTGALTENLSAGMTAIEYVNCEITGYAKAIYSVASSASAASVAKFLVDGCYVHDINAAGTEGGDFIDVRAGSNGSFTVSNSTFYACARTFFRMSDNATVESVLAENCTFNLVTATNSSSNNAGIFAVRVKTGAHSVKAVKNVFLNEFSEKEDATTTWVRLCRNSTDSYRPDCSGNVYYNTGDAWYVSTAVPAADDTQGDKTFEEVAKNEATLLSNDPCINSIAGKLYLDGTNGALIKTLKAGDPRWWDAVQPVVIRPTELTVAPDEYTWDFTEKTIYDTEEITAPTIIGNARIYANASVPANVVMSKGINFSKTAALDEIGVPVYSAVEVLTAGYGALVVTGESANGLGSFQVLAGGDRYAVLADGQAHKVLLGDLEGEHSLYVIANSAATLKKVVWTKDLTPDPAATPLSTPKLTVSPAKVQEDEIVPVTFSWNVVENAADYVLTFDGSESVLTETSLTISAEAIAALKVGEYPVTVVARPVATSSKWVASEAAEATFTLVAKPAGKTVTLTWDFSDAAWQTEFAKYGAAGTDITNWDVTVDGLQFYSKAKSKYNTTYIQMGGKGSTSDRFFKFTAPAAGTLKVWATNTGSSQDLTRVVTVSVDGNVQTLPGGYSVNDGPVETEFDIAAGEVYIYAGGNALRFYKVEFTYEPPVIEYDWDFSSAVWQTEFAKYGAAGTDITNWDLTVDGLQFFSKAKSKYNTTYIQMGGKGSTSDRFFKFTAPEAGTLKVWATNTGSSEDLTRVVTVSVDGNVQTLPGGYSVNDGPVETEFSIAAGEVYIYAGGNGLRFYHVHYINE